MIFETLTEERKAANAESAAKKHKAAYENRKKTFQLCSMCAVPVVLLIIFNYIPMFGIILAFKDFRFDLGIIGSKWVGIDNFVYLIKSGDFTRILRNTICLNLLFIFADLVSQVGVALLLDEVRKSWKLKLYQTSMILPHFISWVIVGYIVYAILNPQYGVINSLIEKMGGTGINWYNEPKYWPAILTLARVWKGVGIGCVTYYACLMGIDTSYYEAAAIDGATKRQQVWHITIPSLVPLMTIMTILAIGKIMRADFGLFYQVSRNAGELYSVTDVMDTYIYRVMRVQGDMTVSSAASFLQSVVGCILVLITNYIVTKIEPDNALF